MELKRLSFGFTKSNEEVFLYSFKGENIEAEILSYGGVIKSIKTPDRDGKFENIVLAYNTIEEYEKDDKFLGAIVGRIAGRTRGGILKIAGEEYHLEKNNCGNNLHGGTQGFNTKNWKEEAFTEINGEGILKLSLHSPHLDSGFPGALDIEVTYTVRENEIEINYLGKSDRDTYMSLTNHSYFNLSGNEDESVEEQELKLYSEEFIKVDEATLPVKIESDETFYKNGEFVKLGEVFQGKHPQVEIVGGGYDHPFILSKKHDLDGGAVDRKSGRALEFKTDQPAAVIYTGNFLDKKHSGFCIETQDYPDVFNLLPEKVKIYNKNNLYVQKTTFKFSRI